ncbi:hypothetical protein LCGC14_0477110 [marine sediment metagenome]|uniref:Uncharacterized protein n=1 Tax=marine sediment metagenome TaxID=412755 RepID=A0A0F9SFS3_9ZZZZ
MILLTEEEIKNIFRGKCLSSDCSDCTHGCKFVAEAQLKKVVEWLRSTGMDKKFSGLDWQSLLEEIKDATQVR